VPLLDAVQIDAQRRGGGREVSDHGQRKAGRGEEEGGGGGGRERRGGGRRGRLRLVEKWRRRMGIGVRGVNIYKHHNERRLSDHEIDGFLQPRC
jgi:hypothetical protein